MSAWEVNSDRQVALIHDYGGRPLPGFPSSRQRFLKPEKGRPPARGLAETSALGPLPIAAFRMRLEELTQPPGLGAVYLFQID